MQTAELLAFLVRLFPAFEAQWGSEDNLHRAGDDFTAHGLCAEFSAFYRAQALPLDPALAQRLFAEVEAIVASDPDDHNPVANALCTCWLENIANTAAGAASRPFMGPVSRRYFEAWHTAA